MRVAGFAHRVLTKPCPRRLRWLGSRKGVVVARGPIAVNRGVNSNPSELAAGEFDRSLPFNADQNA